MLEELGLIVRNIRLHDQVASNHDVLAGVLRELGSACVVINRDLDIVHANKAARHYFSRRRTAELEFNDLPATLGSKVYQVFQTGSAIAPFEFNPPDSPRTVYQVTISPVQQLVKAEAPSAVMLLAEDRTKAEELKRLEVDSSNLQQVKTIGGRLAHEINNAVMPLHLIQQELEKRVKDRDLTTVFADSVKRIARRGAEMRALAQDSIISRRVFPLAEVIQEAFEEAQRHQSGTAAKLSSDIGQLLTVNGDREAIKLALTEVLLNAIQANSKDPKVAISSDGNVESAGAQSVTLEIRDNGPGFSAEALQKALQPFYTTKTVGLGVGLAVAEKIISIHRGSLTIGNAAEGTGAVIKISLPVEPAPAKERTEKRPAAAS
jgi:nitrogen fixation/metabolism regulation signal transduction histidine kinase